MDIQNVNPPSPLVLQELLLHLPHFVVDPLIIRVDAFQLVRRQGDIFPTNDSSRAGRRDIRMKEDSALAYGDLWRRVECFLDVLCRDEVSAVCWEWLSSRVR